MDFKSIKSAYQELSGFVDRAKTDSGENTLKAFAKCIETSIKYIERKMQQNLEHFSETREHLIQERLDVLNTEFSDLQNILNDPDICYTEDEMKSFEKQGKPTFENVKETLDDPDYLNYLENLATTDQNIANDIETYYDDFTDLDHSFTDMEDVIENIESSDEILEEITNQSDPITQQTIKDYGNQTKCDISTDDFIKQMEEMKNQRKMIDEQMKSLRKSYLQQSGLTFSAIGQKVATPLKNTQKEIINMGVKATQSLGNVLTNAQTTAKSQYQIMKQNAVNLTQTAAKGFNTFLEASSLGGYSKLLEKSGHQLKVGMDPKYTTQSYMQNIKNGLWKNGKSPVDHIVQIPNITAQKIHSLKQQGQYVYQNMKNDIDQALTTAKNNIQAFNMHLKNNVTLMNGMMKANILGSTSVLFDKVADLKQIQANKQIVKENEIIDKLTTLQNSSSELAKNYSDTMSKSSYQANKIDLKPEIQKQMKLVKAMGNPLNALSMKSISKAAVLQTKQTLHNGLESVKEWISKTNKNMMLNTIQNQYDSVQKAIDQNIDACYKTQEKYEKANNSVQNNREIANDMLAKSMAAGREGLDNSSLTEIVDD